MRPKIQLINCTSEIIKIILKGDDAIAMELKLKVPENWTTFGPQSFEYALTQVADHDVETQWGMYIAVLSETQTLVGSGGYKGPPNEKGEVEIGYEVAPAFEKQGIATEMSRQFIEKAFRQERVEGVLAHTLAEENASVAVLRKNNFFFVEEFQDEEDGAIWKWELLKSNKN